MSAPRFIDLSTTSPEERAALMVRVEADLGPYLESAARIVERVRTGGDAALAKLAQELEKAPVTADAIAATEADFDRAFDELDPEVTAAIEYAVANIRRFHEDQKPEEMWLHEMRPGAFAGDRFVPIDSVACYVPRGKGAFPSVAMMTTIPAVVAGVRRVVVLTPPTPEGTIDAATLVVCRFVGITEVFKCGGAQAVAAVAYGTETVPRCLKLVGPGSPWVLAGKHLLANRIDPGTPAGPSESIILADETTNPRIAALDLMIEAEHGPDSSAYLVTNSQAVADGVLAAVPEYWQKIGEQRRGFSQAVLGGPRGGIVLAPDMAAAIDFVNDYAPEHLEITGKEPLQYLGAIRNAGEILLGENSPLCIANYLLGPNAVLPTGGNARTWSPLSVFDFMKRISVGHITAAGYAQLAPKVHTLATYEGFDSHALAVSEERTRAANGV